MTAASISGTTHGERLRGVNGFTFNTPGQLCTLECGAADLSMVVTVSPGQAVEVASCDNQDVVTSGWTSYTAGQSFSLVPADGRRVARMVGVGGAGLRAEFTGDRVTS